MTTGTRGQVLDSILSGEDTGYDPGGYPDEETAVLGRLDEDFQPGLNLATTTQVP
jgi:hypothetical protein